MASILLYFLSLSKWACAPVIPPASDARSPRETGTELLVSGFLGPSRQASHRLAPKLHSRRLGDGQKTISRATPPACTPNSRPNGAQFRVMARGTASGSGARARIRTWGLPLRRRSLYPTELHALIPIREYITTNVQMAHLHTATHVFTAALRRFDLAMPVRALGDVDSCAVV